MASPAASSSSSSSAGTSAGVPDWVLLDRTARIDDLHPGKATTPHLTDLVAADVFLHLASPPGISTVFVDRALLPAAVSDTPTCRVEGADASGRLLLAFASPREPGGSHLVVCRPVASRSSGTAEGKSLRIPAFPGATELGLALSPAAPAGIAKSGDGFVIAQLQSATTSTPTDVVALALCFSSEEEAWTLKQVPGEERWRGFAATRVVSHDRGVRGDDVRLVFVDLRRGLLLLHPRVPAASQFVALPRLPEARGGGTGIEDASVDSCDGKVVYVVFFDVPDDDTDSTSVMVGFWELSVEDLVWHPYCKVASDEVLYCHDSLVKLQVEQDQDVFRAIGPVHPDLPTRLFMVLASSSAAVDVQPTGNFTLARVKLVGSLEACDATETALVSRICHDPTSWTQKVVKGAKEMGKHLFRVSRENFHLVPKALDDVGTALNLPYTGPLVSVARALAEFNTSAGFNYDAPPAWEKYHCIETTQQAVEAIRLWEVLRKPAEMKVKPASGVSLDQVEVLRAVFLDAGAERLMDKAFDDYVMVEPAHHF